MTWPAFENRFLVSKQWKVWFYIQIVHNDCPDPTDVFLICVKHKRITKKVGFFTPYLNATQCPALHHVTQPAFGNCLSLSSSSVRGTNLQPYQFLQVNVSTISHLGDILRIIDINHLKSLVVISISGVVVVTLDVVETVGTVCGGHWHHFGEIGEIYSVLALLASGDDWQEVVAPHNLLRNKRCPYLAGGARGFCCTF